MSLINEMLRDLEKRRKREERSVSCDEVPVVVEEQVASSKLLFFGGGILLLAGAVWIGITLIPHSLPINPSFHELMLQPTEDANKVIARETPPAVVPTEVIVAATDEKLPLATLVANKNSPPMLTNHSETTLRTLGILEVDDVAQLSLSFAHLPEYRLLQNGLGEAQLVISFNHTQIGDDFEIPQLTGTILKRVSLLPQKQTLQLLVDLDQHAQIQSFQLVDDSDQGYRLLIDIAVVAPAVEKPQIQASVPAKAPQMAAKSVETKTPEKSKISKNKNTLSPDQLAYQAGLKQLSQGNWAAAEVNFNQALLSNPELLDARLQLVGVLQQQMKLDKAEEILRQGIQLTPANTDLRKTYARLLLKAQRQGEAIDLLKTEPVPSVIQDLEYHALLAALLQDSKQFKAASLVYGDLVQARPQEALWWMGLAISLEQSGNAVPARNAYQKALTLPGLRPDLQNYIHGRLQTL
ncbi:MAG: hypothetical protein QM483_09005 [Desulfuromusa sp.]